MKYFEEHLDDPVRWGRELIRTQDHDPLYTALHGVAQSGAAPYNRIRRFLVAYWLCYSVGASWWISGAPNGEEFWFRMYTAARNETEPTVIGGPVGGRWPRAHERRHWRGQKAIDSVLELRRRYPNPERMVLEIESLGSSTVVPTLKNVELVVTDWPQFGPWIAFKAADMVERVMDKEIDFPDQVTTLYRDPRRGAEMMAPLLHLETPQQVTDHLLAALGDEPAPPLGEGRRNVNVQEVETVLCKWKSARNGKYHIGADTASHRAELAHWGGHELLAAYPSVPG